MSVTRSKFLYIVPLARARSLEDVRGFGRVGFCHNVNHRIRITAPVLDPNHFVQTAFRQYAAGTRRFLGMIRAALLMLTQYRAAERQNSQPLGRTRSRRQEHFAARIRAGAHGFAIYIPGAYTRASMETATALLDELAHELAGEEQRVNAIISRAIKPKS